MNYNDITRKKTYVKMVNILKIDFSNLVNYININHIMVIHFLSVLMLYSAMLITI